MLSHMTGKHLNSCMKADLVLSIQLSFYSDVVNSIIARVVAD